VRHAPASCDCRRGSVRGRALRSRPGRPLRVLTMRRPECARSAQLAGVPSQRHGEGPAAEGIRPMRSYIILAAWSLLAGAGIPFIGVLNSGLSKSVGNPFTATAVMFAIAMVVAFALSFPLYGPPTLSQLGAAPKLSHAAGLLG